VLTDAALIDWVRDEFGIALTSLTPVFGGADAAAEVWRARTAAADSYAIKVSHRGMTVGLEVAAHLAANGVPEIPAPHPARGGAPSSVRDGDELSLTPWVAGRPGLDGGITIAQWREFGAIVARVHAAELPVRIRRRVPRETYPFEATAAVRAIDTTIRRRPGGDALTGEVIEYWLGDGDRITSVVERTEALGRRLRDQDVPMLLTHGDAHLGNVLTDTAERLWFIDWDDVSLAPPERDLMFVIDWAIGDEPVTQPQRSAFFTGYGDIEINPDRLAYYRCIRALEDLGGFAAEVLDEQARARPDRVRARDLFVGQLAPAGIVNAALA